MIDVLLPRATMLTPNLPELRQLGSRLGLAAGASEECLVDAIMAWGCASVLVKGGHDSSPAASNDRLYLASGDTAVFTGPRFPLTLRGTGCHLASTIAVGIAAGASKAQAVRAAKAALNTRFRNASCSFSG